MKKQIDDKNIKKVTGGQEPEEFDWEPTGYVTPVKEENKQGWAFSAIGSGNRFFDRLFNRNKQK